MIVSHNEDIQNGMICFLSICLTMVNSVSCSRQHVRLSWQVKSLGVIA